MTMMIAARITPIPSSAYASASMSPRIAAGHVGLKSAAGTDATIGGTTGSSQLPYMLSGAIS